MGRFSGKVAVVVGGGSGIGGAIAQQLASEGASVYATSRRVPDDRTVPPDSGSVSPIQADAGSREDLERVFATVAAERGRIDVLVLNAGRADFAPLDAITEEHFDDTFGLNVRALVFAAQSAVALMPAGGTVVLVGSIAVDALPKLELDLNFNGRLVDVAEEGFDLVVRNVPSGNWPGLAGRRIAHQHMRGCAAPAYLAAAGTPTSLADLTGHRAALYGRPGRVRSWLFPRRMAPRKRSSRRAGCASTTSARSATPSSPSTASLGCRAG